MENKRKHTGVIIRFFSGALFFLVLSSCGVPGSELAGGVISNEIRIVEAMDGIGEPPSLAFNSSGTPIISYEDHENGSLKIAEFAGGEWTITTIDEEMAPAQQGENPHTSLAVNASGSLGICYIDKAGGRLKYAFKSGSSSISGTGWKIRVLDQGADVGSWVSLKLDKDDRAHISYYVVRMNTRDPIRVEEVYPKYMVYDGKTPPVSEVIDARLVGVQLPSGAMGSGLPTSLVLSSDGTPYVSYYDPEKRSVNIARRLDGGGWTVAVIDGTSDKSIGQFHSLAVDAHDRLHVSYTEISSLGGGPHSSSLKYAVYDGTLWHRETVEDVKGEVRGVPNSLTLGPDSSPIISYVDNSRPDLKLAFLRQGNWRTFRLDTGGLEGTYSSVASSPLGTTGVAYCQNSDGASPPRRTMKFSLVEY